MAASPTVTGLAFRSDAPESPKGATTVFGKLLTPGFTCQPRLLRAVSGVGRPEFLFQERSAWPVLPELRTGRGHSLQPPVRFPHVGIGSEAGGNSGFLPALDSYSEYTDLVPEAHVGTGIP